MRPVITFGTSPGAMSALLGGSFAFIRARISSS
jgi:hypothetical protein